MNQLPQELRTPPLPVVAFISCPELHKDIGTFFNANLRPPLFFVSLPEANESVLARLFGTPKQHKAFSTPDGILKADWISKQRTRRAAVAATFVQRSDVEGDPNAWMRMTRGLQAVKAASAHKGVWLVLVVVQDGPLLGAGGDLPQDRITGLWNSFEPKQLLLISRQLFDPSLPPDQRKALQDEQLRPLQQLLTEAAAAYYTAAGGRLRQKQLDLASSLGSCPPEISAAIAFKLAVFAEFRQDWPGAVTSYQAAAAALQAVPLGRPTASCQRHAEVAAVAEVVHFKAMMLLLHQQRYGEAVQQLATHLAVFGRVPDGLPLPAVAAHYGWLARQYQIAAEMITGSRMDGATLQAHPEAAPCNLLMSAAQAALTRKTLGEQLTGLNPGPIAFDVSSIKRGRYLGQFERKQPEGPTNSCDLTDAEFCHFLEAEERRINHCQVVLDLMVQAQAAHIKDKDQTPQQQLQPQQQLVTASKGGRSAAAADRVSARLAYLIAEQQVETHNLTAARKLLLQVVYTYRRDGWDALLLHSLLLLRDVCQRLKLHRESLLHSLELAALADSLRGGGGDGAGGGSGGNSNAGAAGGGGAGAGVVAVVGAASDTFMDHEQAQGLASAALLGLLAGPQDNKSSLKKPAATAAAAAATAQQPQQQPATAGGGDPQQQQQQSVDDVQQGFARVSVGGSPRGGSNSSSSSSGSWEYVVQQLDLAAALQQVVVPPAAAAAGGRDDAAGAMTTGTSSARASPVADILLLHKQQDFGWWRLITVSVGFVAHSPDPAQLCLCVALRSNLPVPLPLESATVTLSDAQGSWQVVMQLGGPPPTPVAAAAGAAVGGSSSSSSQGTAGGWTRQHSTAVVADVTSGVSQLQIAAAGPGAHATHPLPQQQQQQQQAWPLQLQPGVWQQLHVAFAPRCIGTVACEQLELRLSPTAAVVFKVQSFAPGRPALGSSSIAMSGVDSSPFCLQQQVKQGAWVAKVQHVGRLPQLQLLTPPLMLVGEFVPVDIRVEVSAAQPAATLELSVRTPAGASTPSDTLTLLAALPDGKLHELSLEAQVLAVPKLAPGAVWTQRLWARSRGVPACRLSAALSCPALVVAHTELHFRQPFEHRVRLCAEAGVHTLVGPSPAFAAVNIGSSSGGSAGGGGPDGFSSGSSVVLAAAAADAAGGDGSSSGSVAVPLVVGQSLLAQVLVGTTHSADLLLLGAELQLEPGSQLKVLNSLQQQLAGAPLPATSGSVHCLLLQLLPTAKASAPVSMGRLKLSWRRKDPAQVEPADASSSSSGADRRRSSSSGCGGTSTSAAAAAAGGGVVESSGPAVPSLDVETSLELPRVVVQDSLLSAKVSGPQNVTAGTSFPFTLQIHNLTTQPQEVQVSVQETQGFVFAGSKQQVVNVVPRTIHNITWTLVAHASGQLQLPAVRVVCTKLNCSIVTQGGPIHVMPY